MVRSRLLPAAALAILALVASACSDDEDEAAATEEVCGLIEEELPLLADLSSVGSPGEVVPLFERLADSAPSDIAGEFRTLLAAVETIAEGDPTDAADAVAYGEALATRADQDVIEASRATEAWVQERCGVALGEAGPSSSEEPAPEAQR